MQLIDTLVAQAPDMAALRRDLHAHPELSFQEVRTADLVAERLQGGDDRGEPDGAERDVGGKG